MGDAELGRLVGLSHVTIGNYLAGDWPKGQHLLSLANHFNVSMDWLAGRETAQDGAPAFRETPDASLVDAALNEMEDLKEKVQSLDRALKRIKKGKL